MEITIITVGKLKEKFLKEGIREYLKRMTPYAKIKMIEVNDEPAGQSLSEAEIEQVKRAEGARILEKIPTRARVIALDLRGKNFSSEEFAAVINETMIYGANQITFIIGGSHGLDQAVLQKADLKLSFGKFTYPHQLMRLILVEQIYRAFKIIRNEPYHK